jgi:hypothetical protein
MSRGWKGHRHDDAVAIRTLCVSQQLPIFALLNIKES